VTPISALVLRCILDRHRFRLDIPYSRSRHRRTIEISSISVKIVPHPLDSLRELKQPDHIFVFDSIDEWPWRINSIRSPTSPFLNITTYHITISYSEIPRLDPLFLDVYTCTAEMAGMVVHVYTSGEGWLRRLVSRKGRYITVGSWSSSFPLGILVLGSYVRYV
jgi:hypothetical protein